MAMMTAQEAREFLTGFDHGSHPLAVEYLNVALDRLLVTMDLVPNMDSGARVLELGATPYFMTSLLLHHFPYQLELANEPGREKYDGGTVRLTNRGRGLDYSFQYKGFNIETDRFPYDDGSFDMVLYCEMIEHLMHDPSHSLYEIHRVLKPGGYLLLSTPNPFRYTNYLRFLAGTNIYPPFSGYGPYSRHNREFSAAELRLLLKQSNFEIETLITAHDPAYDHPKRLDGAMRWLHRRGFFREKMDVIHLRARAKERPIYRYPPELYLDVHAFQRIVNDNTRDGRQRRGTAWNRLLQAGVLATPRPLDRKKGKGEAAGLGSQAARAALLQRPQGVGSTGCWHGSGQWSGQPVRCGGG